MIKLHRRLRADRLAAGAESAHDSYRRAGMSLTPPPVTPLEKSVALSIAPAPEEKFVDDAPGECNLVYEVVLIVASGNLPTTEEPSQGHPVQRQNSKGRSFRVRKKASRASIRPENDSAELDKIDKVEKDYQKLIQNDKKRDQPTPEQIQKLVPYTPSHDLILAR